MVGAAHRPLVATELMARTHCRAEDRGSKGLPSLNHCIGSVLLEERNFSRNNWILQVNSTDTD